MSREITPLSREFWMPNNSAKACFKCDKPFTTLRRRHHCRYCGLIFCAKCSKKKSRIMHAIILERSCDACRLSIGKDLSDAPVSVAERIDHSSLSDESFEEDASNESLGEPLIVETTEPEHRHNSSEKVKELCKELSLNDPEATEYLQELTKKELAAFELSLEWTEVISALVKQTAASVCPSVYCRTDKMNINEYVKIVKIKYSDNSLCRYVNGLVIKKNLAHKRMKNVIEFPKILFLHGGAECFEGDAKLLSIEKLINQEGSFLSILVKKIKQAQASIVVNERSIPHTVIEKLAQLNIAAVTRVKLNNLRLLARATQGQVLESVDRIANSKNYLGRCCKVSRQVYGNASFLFFEDPFDPTLAGSIILSGPNSTDLKKVSSIIRRLLIVYRNLLIEHYYIQHFRIRNFPGIYSSLYSNTMVASQIVLYNLESCHEAKPLRIEYYYDSDKALGQYFLDLIKQSEDVCPADSSHYIGSHKLYFLGTRGRIKISLSKSSSHAQDLTFSKKCKACNDRVDFASTVPKVLWEYSFHKFLNNFFCPDDIFHETKSCRHDYFKFCKYMFQFQNIKIHIEFEEHIVYELLSIPYTTDTSKQRKGIFKNAFEDFLRVGKDSLDHLQTQLRNKKDKIQDITEQQLEESSKIEYTISRELSNLMSLKIDDYSNHLEVERLKKSLYSVLCDLKLSIENLVLLPQRTDTSYSIRQVIDFIDKDDEFLQSPHFTALKRGSPTLPLCQDRLCVPVEEFDSLSIIAYALSSTKYTDSISNTLPLCELNSVIETELLSGNEEHFSIQFSTYEDPALNEIAHKPETRKLYGSNINYYVKAYFPRQFHCIRLGSCGSPEDFLMSITSSLDETMQLAKKGSFKFSYDQKYIIKIIEEKEFKMFIDIAPNYFRHICKAVSHSMPSLLAKTLGAFKVVVKNQSTGRNRSDLILIYGNLLFGMPMPVQIYDLKGTPNQNRKAKNGEAKTKMDVNFIEDLNGLPVVLTQSSKKLLEMGLWNDTIFLAKQNIVDYSLLVILSVDHKKIAAGIIDYMEQYTLEKALEYKYKKYMVTENPTITSTKLYKDRFRKQILSSYFLSIED